MKVRLLTFVLLLIMPFQMASANIFKDFLEKLNLSGEDFSTSYIRPSKWLTGEDNIYYEGNIDVKGYVGILSSLTAGSIASGVATSYQVDANSVGQVACLALGDDGNLQEANASGANDKINQHMPCFALALETSTGEKEILLNGFIRNDSWNWIKGEPIYVDATNGGITQTPPTSSGDQVQVVGMATQTNHIFFRPSFDIVEIDDGVGGATGVPGGLHGYVQYNNNGAFGGASDLFWDDANNRLGIGTTTPDEKLQIAGAIHLNPMTAPTTTTNKLYNVGGSLYWGGINLLQKSFTNLTDTPGTYSGQSGKIVKVNAGEDALVFADETTYSAGDGIDVSSNTFSVSAGNGLAQTSTGLETDAPSCGADQASKWTGTAWSCVDFPTESVNPQLGAKGTCATSADAGKIAFESNTFWGCKITNDPATGDYGWIILDTFTN